MQKPVYLLLLLLLSTLQAAHAQRLVTEVIPLGYRSVNEIAPILQPLVAPHGSVSGLPGQLVVTGTASQISEVRRLLASLDKAPVRLLISVKRDNSVQERQGSASVQGTLGNVSINDGGASIGTSSAQNRRSDENSLTASVQARKLDEDRNIMQQVQVLEGREAYIYTGEEIPVRNRGAIAGPGGVYGYDNVEFYPAVTGFYAVPRLNGDDVILDINTVSRERHGYGGVKVYRQHPGQAGNRYPYHPNRRAGQIETSGLSTTVTGKLGEWLQIGNVGQSGNSRQSGIGSLAKQRSETSSGVYIRVEKISER